MICTSIRDALRRQMAAVRDVMTANELADSNDAIMRRIVGLHKYRRALTVFTYVGFVVDVDTFPLIDDAVRAGKRVVAPRYVSEGEMRLYEIHGHSDLEVSGLGILEPRSDCRPISPGTIQFAVVPALRCDRLCGRVGYDSGLIDAYLRRRWLYPAVAPCREALLSDWLPQAAAFAPVDMVVSENEVYHRRHGAYAES